jgi:hypothetical protein
VKFANTALAFVVGAVMATNAFAAAIVANAEPDISCATGDATGLDTAGPGFVRPYPSVCVDKALADAHAEGFTAPGGDAELVSLGKIACHALDTDAEDTGHAAEKAVLAAEPKLVASAPDPGFSRDTIYDDFVANVAMKGLCP